MASLLTAALSLLLAPAGAAPAAGAPTPPAPPTVEERQYTQLTSGRYALKVSGMLCTVCAKAVEAELAKLDEVESVKSDFDLDLMLISIKIEKVLKVSTLRRALQKAARRVNMGAKLDVASLQYRP
ncbi:MAG: heavy-metal-associated domain-containing protein [Elusimicrobiota bacterium]